MKPTLSLFTLAFLLAFAPSAEAQLTWNAPIGVDRCAATSNPALPNYWQDVSECTDRGRWLIGTQAEASFSQACTGTNGQSLPINAGGPLSISFETLAPWAPNHAVRMTTDFVNYRHPCTGSNYTWFSLMDHLYGGGGPFPSAEYLQVYFNGIYNETIGDQKGASRMGVAWNGNWGGKNMYLEVDFYVHPSWGDSHPDEDLAHVGILPDGTIYVRVLGSKVNSGMPLGVHSNVWVDFGGIIHSLIARGIFPAPAEGEAWKTTVIGPYTETHAPTRNKRSIWAQLLMYWLMAS